MRVNLAEALKKDVAVLPDAALPQADFELLSQKETENQEVLQKLGQCSVMLHPSLHVSSGWVTLEAGIFALRRSTRLVLLRNRSNNNRPSTQSKPKSDCDSIGFVQESSK